MTAPASPPPTEEPDQQPQVFLSVATVLLMWFLAALVGDRAFTMAAAMVPEPTYPSVISSISVARTIGVATFLVIGCAGTFLAIVHGNRRLGR